MEFICLCFSFLKCFQTVWFVENQKMCNELRVTSLDTRATISNLQVTSLKPRVTSSNPRVRRLKAQVSRLKPWVGRLKALVRIWTRNSWLWTCNS